MQIMASNMDNIGRRDFLKTAAGALAGTAVLPKHSHAADAREEPLKVAIVGAGRSGAKAVETLLKIGMRTKITAIADVFADEAERLQKRGEELSKKYADPREIFDVPPERMFSGLDAYKSATDCADIVVFATPPVFRPQEAEYAIARGKHVFLEKPICVDSVQAHKMYKLAEIARAKKLTAVCGLQRRFHSGYREAMQRLSDGQIGEILYAQCDWFLSHFDGMDLKPSCRTDDPEQLEYQLRNWGLFVWTSGDHIVEQQVHNLDIIRWALGKTPQFVSAIGGRRVNLEMPKYGNRFSHFASELDFGEGLRVFARCRQEPNTTPQVLERIVGTKGVLQTSLFSNQTIRGEKNWTSAPPRDPVEEEYRCLVNSVRNSDAVNMIAETTDSCMLAIASRMSAYSGLRFKFEWALRKPKTSLMPQKLQFGKLPIAPLAMAEEYRII